MWDSGPEMEFAEEVAPFRRLWEVQEIGASGNAVGTLSATTPAAAANARDGHRAFAVCFDDGDKLRIEWEHQELDGAALARAEVQLASHGKGGQAAGGGGQTPRWSDRGDEDDMGLAGLAAAVVPAKVKVLGFGSGCNVSIGEAWRFLGSNLAILISHSGGPKEDCWLEAGSEKYKDIVFLPPDLGRFELTYNKLCEMMRAFTLRESSSEPFDPMRKFHDKWNLAMVAALSPS
eukprot:jgi/Tetstr1/447464/TSEL_003721.t1